MERWRRKHSRACLFPLVTQPTCPTAVLSCLFFSGVAHVSSPHGMASKEMHRGTLFPISTGQLSKHTVYIDGRFLLSRARSLAREQIYSRATEIFNQL